MVASLDDGYAAAEAAEQLGEFDADRAAADHKEVARRRGEFHDRG